MADFCNSGYFLPEGRLPPVLRGVQCPQLFHRFQKNRPAEHNLYNFCRDILKAEFYRHELNR